MSNWAKSLDRFSPEVKIQVGFGLALGALVLVGVLQYRTIRALEEADFWVAHTHEVMAEAEGIYSALEHVESGALGYVATGDEDYVRQHEAGISRLSRHLEAFRSLTGDSPRQQRNLDRLMPIINHKIAFSRELIALRRERGFEPASQILRQGEGLELMNELRDGIDAMLAEERRLLEDRRARSRVDAKIADAALIVGVLLALILGMIASLVTRWHNSKRQRAEQELRRVNRALRTISECNQTIVRATEEARLLEDICGILVRVGGYRMAWVGYGEHDEGKSVRPVAHAGFEEGYLQSASITWADTERGRGPTGTAVRTGRPVVARNTQSEPSVALWRREALKRGYASSIALPILLNDQVLGALTIYAESPDAFDTEEMQLLLELSRDLAHGIQALRTRAERKRAEDALGKANAYNRSLIEASPDPLVTISTDGRITDVNTATERVTGFSRQELVGTDFSNYFTDPSKARVGYQQVFREGIVRDYELEIRHREGHLTPVIYTASVYRDEAGKVAGVFAAARDIAKRKRAERELRKANAYNRSLLEASLDPLVTISADGRITDLNTATERLTGLSRQELIGTDFSEYFTDAEKARAGYQQVFRESSVHDFELEVRHHNGQVTPVVYNASLYRDEAGQVAGVFAAARDITQRKRAEEEVRKLNEQLERRVRERTAELEAANKELEAFTYSVSHDLRAPLRHADGFSKLLVEEHCAELSSHAQEYVAMIRDAVLQMSTLIDDLLNLARVGRNQLSMQVTGLNSLVEEVRTDLDRANPERLIEWKIETLPFVECDPALVKQVFANLLSNAVKFTRPRKPAVIEVGVTYQDGARAVFVRDNGVGFSMKYAHKLFGVFQRLHRAEDFEGTGVGLATVQRIIHKHGGRVWAEAELDKGATFYFTLGSSDGPQPGKPTDSGGNP